MSALLEVSGLTVQFGGLVANDHIDLHVRQDEIVGLIGPNGAGKTTFVDALSGFVPATGSVRFAGTELLGLKAYRRTRLGLGRTWQSLELFDDLTVRENLMVASQPQSVRNFLADVVRPTRPQSTEDVDFAIETLAIQSIADRYPREISQGYRKLVSTARALAGRPKLLCMDEPAAGLNNSESEQLASRLRGIVDEGIGILLIDHDMKLVLGASDRIAVIDFGAKIADGTSDEVRADPRVIAAYLGDSGEEANDD